MVDCHVTIGYRCQGKHEHVPIHIHSDIVAKVIKGGSISMLFHQISTFSYGKHPYIGMAESRLPRSPSEEEL